MVTLLKRTCKHIDNDGFNFAIYAIQIKMGINTRSSKTPNRPRLLSVFSSYPDLRMIAQKARQYLSVTGVIFQLNNVRQQCTDAMSILLIPLPY